MSRRDTITIAILINVGLLSILFLLGGVPESTDQAVADPLPVIAPVEEVVEEVAYHPPPKEIELSPRAFSPPVSEERKIEKSLVQVIVKRGDYLDKIARANGATVEEIKRINHLSSARIDVGQVLLIPMATTKETSPSPQVIDQPIQETDGAPAEYYTLESGDNPWKVARKFHVRFDHLLFLNELDEEKARHLKPGDVLRVR